MKIGSLKLMNDPSDSVEGLVSRMKEV